MTTQNIEQKNKIIFKDELSEVFHNGFKKPSEFKIGLEVEKLPIKKDSFKAVSYYETNGIKDFLEELAKQDNWMHIKQNGHLIGLEKDGQNISLEPGSQFEVSLTPQENIHSCAKYLKTYNKITGKLADKMGFWWLGYGIQPVSTYKDIDVIPKSRYALMGSYLPKKASEPLVMMRETAGIQVSLDYENEQDAINKLRVGILIAPIVSAMLSNSPIRGNSITKYQSYRAHSWLNTDPERCGLISKKLFDPNHDFNFNDYIDTVLDIPMIFVERNGIPVKINGHTFRTFMKKGHNGLEASLDDWALHSSLFFPDVRMKNFIEFRNADCQNPELTLASIALYKGIFYDNCAMGNVFKLLCEIDWETLNTIRKLTPEYGLNTEIKGFKVGDLAKELIKIARASLIKQNQGEAIYLDAFDNYTLIGKTPADVLIETCGNDIKKLAEYTRII